MSEDSAQRTIMAKSMQWAVAWLFILCALFVVNALAILVGLHVFAVTLPVVVILALVGLYWLGKLEGRPMPIRRLCVIGVAFLAAVVLFGNLSSLIWEYSNWGRGYYTEAIVALADGWNPIYTDVGNVSELSYRSSKALWYVDASLYAFLGHYEMAKCHTLLFAVPTFLLTQYGFRRLLGGHAKVAVLAALLSLVNPVAISQLFSFYGDAVLAYCVQCFLILAYLILNEGYLHSDLLTVLAMLWVFILHSQSSGLTAALVVGAGFLGIVAILYKKRAFRWLAIRAGLVVFVGFIILGFNPFVQNLVDTGNPFAMAFGSGAAEQARGLMPLILEGKTWFGKFLYSMMASPDIASLDHNLLLQQFTALFHSAYAQPDVPLRGFGFLGGLLLAAGVFCTLVTIAMPKRRALDSNAIYIDDDETDEEESATVDYVGVRTALLWLLLPVLLIALFTPTLWWARTVAVLWFVVPLAVVALATRCGDGRSHTAKLLLTAAFLNCALVAFSALPAAKMESDALKGYWQRMTTTTDLPSDADAQLHNEIVGAYPVWNDLKAHGEDTRIQHGIWTKIEGLMK